MKYRTLIVDDKSLARLQLKNRLRDVAEIEIVAEAANGFEAMDLYGQLHPGLILLDIQMPGLLGFERLQQLPSVPLVIFTTAYDQYSLKAFHALALDYL